MPGKPRLELIRARQLRGLSQTDVAQKLQVETSSVSRWECGTSFPRNRNLRELAHLYDVPVETVQRWFGLELPPHAKSINGFDPVTLAEAKLIAHAAYREAMHSAGLPTSKVIEIRANADLFIRGFEVAKDQSRPQPENPDR